MFLYYAAHYFAAHPFTCLVVLKIFVTSCSSCPSWCKKFSRLDSRLRGNDGNRHDMIMNNSQRVLITGIDGFTGKYVEQVLRARGYDVYGTVIAGAENPHHIV